MDVQAMIDAMEDYAYDLPQSDPRYLEVDRLRIAASRLSSATDRWVKEKRRDHYQGTSTRWDLMTDADRASAETQPWADGSATCSGCDFEIFTEADFYKHFIIPDLRHYNLGYCPVKGK